MRSQIDLAFKKCKKQNRPALLTYTVAGDNTKEKSLEIWKFKIWNDILIPGILDSWPGLPLRMKYKMTFQFEFQISCLPQRITICY